MQITDNSIKQISESNLNNTDTKKSNLIKPKNYRIKNTDWNCKTCDIYCNSKAQFEVHLMSQKHKMIEKKQEEGDMLSDCDMLEKCDENNNIETFKQKPTIDIYNFSIAEQYKIVAQNYLIPESKRIGKFEKFGFYCSKCDAFMTGQIQLVMHVKGSKHQYYCPGEIPGYTPSKAYNPNFKSQKLSSLNRNNMVNGQQKLDIFNKIYPSLIKEQQQRMHRNILMSTPIKPAHTTGTYMDYLIKNQNLMHGQFYQRVYSYNHQSQPLTATTTTTPVFNQFNHGQQVFNQTTNPSTPNLLTQSGNTGNFFGAYMNQNGTTLSSNQNYQVNQPIRLIATTPSTHSVILLNNESSHLNHSESNKQNSLNSNSNGSNCSNTESCLNRSFESTFANYNTNVNNSNNSQLNGFENTSQLFNNQQPQLHHYSNGVAIISKQDVHHQQPQHYFSNQSRINSNNHFMLAQSESNGISPTAHYYAQQAYPLLNQVS